MDNPTRTMDRFWRKVEKTPSCWNWTAAKTPAGYGSFFTMDDGAHRVVYAHRFSYELANGPAASGMHIDHKCHNPECVNPDHLRAVTVKQNQEHRLGAQVNNRTSGVRGVTWEKRRQVWRTQVTSGGKFHTAGRFASLSDAVEAITRLRNELHTHNDADRAA
jgi:hypothetical protein